MTRPPLEEVEGELRLHPVAGSGIRNLADQARERLEELIVTLQLTPGSLWLEADLCEKLDIGRTPVREALQRLQREHLVEVIPRVGIRISEINVENQLLLLEVRRELERLVSVSAARRATDQERAQCLAMAKTLLGMVDSELVDFLRYHYRVKHFVTEMARNPYLSRMLLPLHAISRRFYYLHHRRTQDVPVAGKYHARVLRAVSEGDEEAAAKASDRLMDYTVRITRKVIDDGR